MTKVTLASDPKLTRHHMHLTYLSDARVGLELQSMTCQPCILPLSFWVLRPAKLIGHIVRTNKQCVAFLAVIILMQ